LKPVTLKEARLFLKLCDDTFYALAKQFLLNRESIHEGIDSTTLLQINPFEGPDRAV